MGRTQGRSTHLRRRGTGGIRSRRVAPPQPPARAGRPWVGSAGRQGMCQWTSANKLWSAKRNRYAALRESMRSSVGDVRIYPRISVRERVRTRGTSGTFPGSLGSSTPWARGAPPPRGERTRTRRAAARPRRGPEPRIRWYKTEERGISGAGITSQHTQRITHHVSHITQQRNNAATQRFNNATRDATRGNVITQTTAPW